MRKLSIYLVCALFLCSCGSNETTKENKKPSEIELMNEIKEVEAVLYSSKNHALNFGDAEKVIELYKGYAKAYPLDSQTPEYLFKAADVSIGLKRYNDAEKLLNRVLKEYPAFDKQVEALYLTAFINDSYLNKKGKAKEIYEKVIRKYPEHKLADDASAAIKILTMSDEELIKMLEEKNGKGNTNRE